MRSNPFGLILILVMSFPALAFACGVEGSSFEEKIYLIERVDVKEGIVSIVNVEELESKCAQYTFLKIDGSKVGEFLKKLGLIAEININWSSSTKGVYKDFEIVRLMHIWNGIEVIDAEILKREFLVTENVNSWGDPEPIYKLDAKLTNGELIQLLFRGESSNGVEKPEFEESAEPYVNLGDPQESRMVVGDRIRFRPWKDKTGVYKFSRYNTILVQRPSLKEKNQIKQSVFFP